MTVFSQSPKALTKQEGPKRLLVAPKISVFFQIQKESGIFGTSRKTFGPTYLVRALVEQRISWNFLVVRIANATLKWHQPHCEGRPLLPAETSQTLLMCLAVGNKWTQVPHYGISLARVSKIRQKALFEND